MSLEFGIVCLGRETTRAVESIGKKRNKQNKVRIIRFYLAPALPDQKEFVGRLGEIEFNRRFEALRLEIVRILSPIEGVRYVKTSGFRVVVGIAVRKRKQVRRTLSEQKLTHILEAMPRL